MWFLTFSALLFLSLASAWLSPRQQMSGFQLQNTIDAISLNEKFASLTPNSFCVSGQDACVSGKFAQCVSGKYVLSPCHSGFVCAALPLVHSPGTSISCTTRNSLNSLTAAAGATG